ncbi:FKBP-type peptidyl-prolyl cis-trans isomerase [Sphingobacterium arenae]|uniref:peptidylprolyl isomerase n=1 Tax=Sphingobacterium arenae TaxID=1280598 RepID=A0ABR7Y8Q0_9SPHI|nr:hypothetical protein [Sphingobacterium arenae]MBD1427603.1 hypothetical protein [Sphingobacterium arenae]
MKALFKPLLVLAFAAVAFSSCMKDNSAEQEAEQRRQQEAIVASLAADKIKIEEYLLDNPSEAPGGWQEDDREETFSLLGKTVKTGIHFEVLAVPTEEDDEAFEYEFSSSTGPVPPKVRVNYTVSLLDGTEVQSGENENFDFATFQSNSNIYNGVWLISFFPKSYRVDGEDRPYYGLTAKGLKKGSHIRVVSPSSWAYGANKVGDIPANSPLLYEFEVLNIE